jgi:hypothetical protein
MMMIMFLKSIRLAVLVEISRSRRLVVITVVVVASFEIVVVVVRTTIVVVILTVTVIVVVVVVVVTRIGETFLAKVLGVLTLRAHCHDDKANHKG